MHTRKTSVIACAAAVAASALIPLRAGAYTTVSTSFQRGVNGYNSETDAQFTSSTTGNTTAGDTKAATGTQLFVDGYNGTDSPDQQVFLKFDNLFGTGAGQIPANAFILDASLTLTTGTSGNSQSGGPFGVGAVLVNWNTTTSTYNNLKPAGSAENGLSAPNGSLTPAYAFYDNPKVYGGTNNLDSAATNSSKYRFTGNVTQVLNGWSSGAIPNYGFVVHAGAPAATTDGWQVKTGTHGTVGDRPLLNVSYTTAPVQTSTFQQGVNGYAGTTMVWLRDDGTTTDGSTINNAFLDGWANGPTEEGVSADDHALIKFNNIFTSQGGSVPNHAVILKAYVKVTTSAVGNAQTGQPYEAHQMTSYWDTNSHYTDFGGYGPLPGSAETTDYSYNYGMIPNSDVYFDITQAVNSWQGGQPNYGVDLRAALDPNDIVNNTNGTNDGWSIYFTGASTASLRPELVVSYFVHLPGDANDDGKINADDLALIDRGFNKHLATPLWSDGDFNYDGVVNAADYLIMDTAWAQAHGGSVSPSLLAAREAEFGADYATELLAAVPEPASLAVCGLAALPLLAGRRRRGA